ncbi:hypothetical protein [Clostridium drakei]|uniref:Uncharacterized protein n=1 Tax=Clostridium drakei TaxID=332101 RepID=A0A2U8DVQ3_9CLOT|nr:hypothetical protein [Clostridium drakei]AWI06719.1 hypothetical protein B9W14_20210 [Clostridium drakei]
MNNEQINEKMACELKALLEKYNIFHGTRIYFNNKCLHDRNGKIELIENIKVEEWLEWCNPEMVSMSFEGANSIYPILNDECENREMCTKIYNKFLEIGKEYDRFYEQGQSWNIYYTPKEITQIVWGAKNKSNKYYYPRKKSKKSKKIEI